MNCPECGQRMWHYAEGWRCRNDHVFMETAVEGVQAKVVRIDRPSARERLQDFVLGCATGCALASVVAAVVVAIVEKL